MFVCVCVGGGGGEGGMACTTLMCMVFWLKRPSASTFTFGDKMRVDRHIKSYNWQK